MSHITALYEQLSEKIPTRDLKKDDKLKLVEKMTSSDLSMNEKETIALLILEDYMRYHPKSKDDMPYSSSQSNLGKHCDLAQFPIRLRHVLKRYFETDREEIAEDDGIRFL